MDCLLLLLNLNERVQIGVALGLCRICLPDVNIGWLWGGGTLPPRNPLTQNFVNMLLLHVFDILLKLISFLWGKTLPDIIKQAKLYQPLLGDGAILFLRKVRLKTLTFFLKFELLKHLLHTSDICFVSNSITLELLSDLSLAKSLGTLLIMALLVWTESLTL